MRILIVSSYAPPHVGGIDSIVGLEIRLLLAQGHEVTLVTSDCGTCGPTPGDEVHERLRIFRIPAWNILERRADICWPIFSPRVLPVLWNAVQWCEVVHVHGHTYMHNPFALLFAALLGKRRLLSMHGFVGYRVWWKKLVVLLAQQTITRLSFTLTNVITTQRQSDIPLLRKLGARDACMKWLLNPVQSRQFYPPTPQQRRDARAALGWEEGRKKIVFVGYVRRNKGAELLLAAGDPGYDIVFCGGCNEHYRNEIVRHGMTYLPPRPHDSMLSLYHAADAVVLPSRFEAANTMAVNEAMACGLPIVLTRYRGSEIYHQPGFKNVFFCDFTPESLKKGIRQAMAQPEQPEHTARCLTEVFPTEEKWVAEIVRLLAGECLA